MTDESNKRLIEDYLPIEAISKNLPAAPGTAQAGASRSIKYER